MTRSIREFRLRANPAYELVLFDRLSVAEQEALSGLKDDTDCYGILRPLRAGNLTLKAASRDAALLFLTLQNPGPLPQYVQQSLGQDCDRTIAQMVLDGILEIEVDGAMLSGPAAHAQIFGGESAAEPESVLAALSRRALQYAETLDITNVALLSSRLYSYNRLPASARWRKLLPDETVVKRHLGIENGTASLHNWTRVEQDAKNASWLAWQSRRTVANARGTGITWKLYVSPACSALRQAFQVVMAVANYSPAIHFKVGNDVYGLLRPDKMVLYFRNFAELQETAEQLAQKLSDCPAHGVPFTSELAGNGLLSWGIDLPTEKHTVPWLQRESWRLWITNRLASALILARTSAAEDMSPWRFALDRLRVEGVDTATWTPAELLREKPAWGESDGAH